MVEGKPATVQATRVNSYGETEIIDMDEYMRQRGDFDDDDDDGDEEDGKSLLGTLKVFRHLKHTLELDE